MNEYNQYIFTSKQLYWDSGPLSLDGIHMQYWTHWKKNTHKFTSFSTSLQDEVNQIMETNLWLRHVSTGMRTLTHMHIKHTTG